MDCEHTIDSDIGVTGDEETVPVELELDCSDSTQWWRPSAQLVLSILGLGFMTVSTTSYLAGEQKSRSLLSYRQRRASAITLE